MVVISEWGMDRGSGCHAEADGGMESERTALVYIWSNVDQNHSPVLKAIRHIYFTALTMLDLEGNLLESIEGLSRMHLPLIQYLDLRYTLYVVGDNRIISVKDIRKAAWPSLTGLSISIQLAHLEKNYFSDATRLTEGGFLGMEIL